MKDTAKDGLLLPVIVLSAIALGLGLGSTPKIPEKHHNVPVQVLVTHGTNTQMGSGIMLDEKRLLTARHVVGPFELADIKVVVLGTTNAVIGKINHPSADAAVLMLAEPIEGVEPVKVYRGRWKEGDKFVYRGAPGTTELLYREGYIAVEEVLEGRREWGWHEVVYGMTEVKHGDSGSGVLINDALAGVLVGGTHWGMTVLIPIETVEEIL